MAALALVLALLLWAYWPDIALLALGMVPALTLGSVNGPLAI